MLPVAVFASGIVNELDEQMRIRVERIVEGVAPQP